MELLVDYIAGVAGGVAIVLVGHPFDTTKTRMQTSPIGFYDGTLDCVKKTLKWEGLGGFYSGMLSPLAGQMFFRATSFATFHQTTKYLSKNEINQVPTSKQLMMAGSLTGLTISMIETPIDLVKTKLQIQIFGSRLYPNHTPQYTTVYGCIKHIFSSYGMSGFYQGWRATVLRNIPGNALFFPVNEMGKRELARRNNIDVASLPFHHRLACGAVAGLSYWVGTFPLDAIKSRSMSLSYEDRMNWTGVVRMMAKEGGLKSFFRGIVPCAARAVPACATMFATVDIVRYSLMAESKHRVSASNKSSSNNRNLTTHSFSAAASAATTASQCRTTTTMR